MKQFNIQPYLSTLKMLLLCAKTIVKESRSFELGCLKKKKMKKKKTFWPFGNFLVWRAVGHKTLKDE